VITGGNFASSSSNRRFEVSAPQLSLEDRAEIHDLYSRYNTSADAGRDEQWVETFTDDGEVHGSSRASGHPELLALRVKARQLAQEAPYHHTQHWIANLILTPHPEFVEGSCYLVRIARNRADGAIVLLTLGCYRDQLVRTPIGWRFARRELIEDPRGL
jgi:hypothetical protein